MKPRVSNGSRSQMEIAQRRLIESLSARIKDQRAIDAMAQLRSAKASWPLARALVVEEDDRTRSQIRTALSKLPAGATSKYLKALLKKNGVEHFQGSGYLKSATEVEIRDAGQTLTGKNVIIATGTRHRSLTMLPDDGELVILNLDRYTVVEKTGEE